MPNVPIHFNCVERHIYCWKLLLQLYENMKQDDIETLAGINDKKELKELARDFGNDDKQIKLK